MRKFLSTSLSRSFYPRAFFCLAILAMFVCSVAANGPRPTPTPPDDTVLDYGREQTYDYFIPIELKTECRHIRFLGIANKDEEDVVPSDHKEFIVDPGMYQKKLTILALNQLPELVCKSIGKVAFYGDRPTSIRDDVGDILDSIDPSADDDEEDTGNAVLAKVVGSHPDLINIYTNARRFSEAEIAPTYKKIRAGNEFFYDLSVSYSEWPEKIKTIIHEAGHCAQYLLDSQTEAGASNARPWSSGLQKRAKNIVTETGLQKSGFTGEWKRVHESFVELDWAKPYAADVVDNLDSGPVAGFLTQYAQRDAWEDFAETLAWMVLNGSPIQSGEFADELEYHEARVEGSEIKKKPMSDADRRAVWPASWYDPCEPLRNVPHVRVTSAKAAVYTKIMFLLDLGLIDEELYKRCASNGGEIKLRLNYTRTDNGFHRVKDFASGQYLYSHKNIKPGFPMDQSEPQTFRINAKGELNTDDGKKYDTQMYLTIWEAKKPSLPRGLYTIKVPSFEIDMPCPQNSPWTFDLVVKEASSNSFCATDGLILFTRSSRQFIEGKMLINTTLGHVLGAPKHDTPNFQVYIRWKRRP